MPVCSRVPQALSLEGKSILNLLSADIRFLKTVLGETNLGVARVSLQGTFISATQQFCNMLGFAASKVSYLSWQDVFSAEQLPAALLQIEKLLAGDCQSYVIERCFEQGFEKDSKQPLGPCYLQDDKANSGSWNQGSWGQVTLSLVREGHQALDYFVVVIEDISDRKQAEAQLDDLIREMAMCPVRDTAIAPGKSFPRQDYFNSLAKNVSILFKRDRVMVIESCEDGPQTLAVCEAGSLQPPQAYPPNLGLFQRVLKQTTFTCGQNIQALFPEDLALAEMKVESAAGVTICNSQGEVVGVIVVMGNVPLRRPQRAEQILKTFAEKALTEKALTEKALTEKALTEKAGAEWAVAEPSQQRQARAPSVWPASAAAKISSLDAREKFLQILLDTLPLSIFWKNRESVFMGCNHNFLKDAGLTSMSEIIGKSDYDLPWGVEQADAYRADDQEVMETATAKLGVVEPLRRADYAQGWIETHKVPVLGPDGDVTGLLGVYRDISDLKQAETALRRSQSFLQTVLDSFPLSIFWKDRDSVYLGANRNFLKTAGLTNVEDLIGKTDYDLPWQANEATTFRADDREVIATNSAKLGIIETQLQANGQQRWIETNKIPLCDDDNQVMGVLGSFRDITDRKQAEISLQLSNVQLARATRLKDEFLASMSHELRTPLNAILGMSEGLQEKVFGDITPEQHSALGTIATSGAYLLELINDILDLSKIEAGQIELDMGPTSIESLKKSTLTFVKQPALKKDIHLRTIISENLPYLLMDERRIRQVLINLLNNAIKFTPEGGYVTLAFEAHTQSICSASDYPKTNAETASEAASMSSQAFLRISITDTGIGIAPEHFDSLFEPFVQLDHTLHRQYEGTGLGLALVKRIVELHNGHINVTSELGLGSCFTLELPYTLAAEPIAKLKPDPVSRPPQAPIHSASAPLILLAEDNKANTTTITSYLQARGYRVAVANNSVEAICLAQAEKPDLILMDIQMPRMDGLEATKRIRRMPELQEIPIIALTAFAMKGDRERCLAAGTDSYLSKPVRLKQLTSNIQTLLAPRSSSS